LASAEEEACLETRGTRPGHTLVLWRSATDGERREDWGLCSKTYPGGGPGTMRGPPGGGPGGTLIVVVGSVEVKWMESRVNVQGVVARHLLVFCGVVKVLDC